MEMQSEYQINRLNTVMQKLVREKQKLEDYYSYEVREKQELVLALAKEKKNLTNELQGLLKEVKRSKHKIKKHSQQMGGNMLGGRQLEHFRIKLFEARGRELHKLSGLYKDIL